MLANKLSLASLRTVTLAADARFTKLNYVNDQIWDLQIDKAELAAPLLRTSYGLRAKNMRIFFRFLDGENVVMNPNDYHQGAVIQKDYPNYASISFYPFEDIQVTTEYWAPECNIIAGRLHFRNVGASKRTFNYELVAILNPAEGGNSIHPSKIEGVNILTGTTGGLSPLLFSTGGPLGNSNPYPSLSHQIELQPEQVRKLTWVQAAADNVEESFNLTRTTATKNWDAEISKLDMKHASQISIITGNADWNTTFALGQKVALSLLHSSTNHLPNDSFVETRQTDQGYSLQTDGRDYNHLWNGQSAPNAWYMTQFLLPNEPEIAKGILKNFFAAQSADGNVDLKPGLSGHRTNMLATPLLANIAWQIFSHTEDRSFLEDVFSSLVDYLHAWFNQNRDQDRDGVPEWQNLLQTGYEENPLFTRWYPKSQGADIALFETPALCAYLLSECNTMIEIADVLGRRDETATLEAISRNLEQALQSSWNARAASYSYWDRDTHTSQRGKILGKRIGPGEIYLQTQLERPSRILIRIDSKDESSTKANISIYGQTETGKDVMEKVARQKLQWAIGIGTITLQQLFSSIERVQIDGVSSKTLISVSLVDHKFKDQSLLLPIWSRIPKPDIAKKLIEKTILDPKKYWRKFGVPAIPNRSKHKGATGNASVWMTWNKFIGSGLLSYGYRAEAAQLVEKLMTALVQSLNQYGTFRRQYHADTGVGMGEENALGGLPPIGFFMDVLGVKVISPWKVKLEGKNPFPWPVIVKYRGLIVERLQNSSKVTFPNQETVKIDDDQACIIHGR